MRDIIVCLVGESGSGKSTIGELLEKEGFNYIQSFTTREPRFKGEKGHIFVKEIPTVINSMICFSSEDKAKHGIIADTLFDGNYYWATKEQYQGKGTSIYIIDPPGIKALKERVKDAEIVVVYLKTSRICRVSRMLKRAGYGLCVPTPRRVYYQISERATHDDEAFKNIEYDFCVDAENDIEEVLRDVKCTIV